MNHCKNCGNNIPDETSTCAEAGFGEGCGKTLRGMSEELKKEWMIEFYDLYNKGRKKKAPQSFIDYFEARTFIYNLLAKQQAEATRIARNELMDNFEENRENWLKYADKKVAEAKEEFVTMVDSLEKRNSIRVRQDLTDEEIGYNQCIADIKSKLTLEDKVVEAGKKVVKDYPEVFERLKDK